MIITWLDISASYSHRSLALPALHSACEAVGVTAQWGVVHGTPNDDPGELAAAVASQRPDIVLATAYLFTHDMLIKAGRRIRELLPQLTIVLGGPEFLGDNRRHLAREPWVDAVLRGEGEAALPLVIQSEPRSRAWKDIAGLCWLDATGAYHDNGLACCPTPFDTSPLDSSFFFTDGPFVSLETSRGCRGRCSYCTSAGSLPVRYASVDWLATQLEVLVRRGVREVRLLDRTFNDDAARCVGRLDRLRTEFPSLRFHLELHPAKLPKRVRDALAKAPAGHLHLEVGLQTSAPRALEAIGRQSNAHPAWQGLAWLCAQPNLETHVDMLAALPEQSLGDVLSDLDRLTGLGPAEIQLEVTKILPGTRLAKETGERGLLYAPDPPYEILATPDMTAEDLSFVRRLSRVVDRFHNPPPLQPIVRQALIEVTDFYPVLVRYLDTEHPDWQPLGLKNRFRVLERYLKAAGVTPDLSDFLRYQWLLHGLPPRDPLGDARRVTALPADDVGVRTGAYDPGDPIPGDCQVWQAVLWGQPHWFVYRPAQRRRATAVLTPPDLPFQGRDGIIKQ